MLRGWGLIAAALVAGAGCGGPAHGGSTPRAEPAPERPAGPAAGPVEDLPLRAGTTWTYAVDRAGYDRDHPETPVTSHTTVRAEVSEVVTRGALTAAVVSDLPGQDGDVVIVRRARAYWFVPLDDALRARLRDPGDRLDDLTADDPLLTFPLAPRRLWCDDEPAHPPFHCTMLEPAEGGPDLGAVRGLPPGDHPQFMIIYRSGPDDSETFVAPGVGITGYGYHHHGTTDSVDMVLVEMRTGS